MAIPEQPFGFVAGRWVLSLADTPMDADRAPDYKPLYPGSVIFNNKLSHRVVTDGSETVGIVKTRYEAKLNEEGRIVDAEEHEFVALPVGVYSVTFSFGQYSWPNFDIEVKAEHTIDSPLWLPSKSPIPAGPGVVHVVSEEARLAAEAAAASAWEAVDTPGRQGPQGVPGPPGDLDAEHLAGAPRLKNLAHDMEWFASTSTIHSQTPRLANFTATARYGYIGGRGVNMGAGKTYYFTAEVKATSDQVFFGAPGARAYHSGSGDWERLTGGGTMSATNTFLVRDDRSSGWDPIEVRNTVLIDLTEAFGAGREPTVEYMDELLAKHGHYIGAVDQFAIGDALQYQTLAGQGMGVRIDTSVGTRVLLDHPGGTTMLYGDTGWRDVTDQARKIAEYTLTSRPGIALRRIGNTVYWNARFQVEEALVGTSSGFNLIDDIPFAFRETPIKYANFQATHTGDGIIYFHNGASSSMLTVTIDGTWSSRFYGVAATYTTDTPWPTTLPGTPA